jgi:DNA polymerase III alpha subunit
MNMSLSGTVPEGTSPPGPASARKPPVENDGNSRHGFRVVPSLSEFYPHPRATPVELAGRIRNFRDFKTSSGTSVGFFELFDSSGSVRVFVPWERVARIGEPLSDGCRVIVSGKVRLRDGRKVCDALEIVVAEGGNGHGETSPDDPSKGDP